MHSLRVGSFSPDSIVGQLQIMCEVDHAAHVCSVILLSLVNAVENRLSQVGANELRVFDENAIT